MGPTCIKEIFSTCCNYNLGYIISSVNPVATLSLRIDPFVKSHHAYGAIYMTRLEEPPLAASSKIYYTK